MSKNATVDVPARAETLSKAEVRLHLLQAVRQVLAREVLPELHSESTTATVHLVLRLLDFLGEDAFATVPSLAARSGLPQNLADELAALSGDSSAGLRSTDLHGIAAALAQLLVRVDRASTQQPEAMFLRKLALHEQCALAALDHHGQGGIADTYAKGMTQLEATDAAGVAQARPIDVALEAVLRRSPRFGDEVTVSALSEIPGGFNKLTTAVTIRRGDREEALIMRRDAKPNPTGFSVVDEYPILQAVFAAGGVPIAEPLLLERDPAVLGSPFLIVRRMPGSTDVSQWRDDPAAGRALAQELARALARLHAIDAGAFLPAGEPLKRVGDYTAAEVERWYRRSQQWRIRPTPAIEAGFAWARTHVPQSTRRPVFVHGDVGFHNMLMDRGHLTALLDWEFSHIGDPMEDLNYCRPFVTAVCEWQVFLDAYYEAGGVRFDPQAEPFFELWPSLRNGSGCDALMRCFLENPGSDLKFAVAGTQHVRRYENAVLEFLGRQPAP